MKLDVHLFERFPDLVGGNLNLLEIVLVLREVEVARSLAIDGFLHLVNRELKLVLDRLLLCFKNRQLLLELGDLFLRLVHSTWSGSSFSISGGLPP